MAADILGDDTVETLLHKNLMFTQLIDKALGVILTLLYRHQVASDHNSGEAPEIGDFAFSDIASILPCKESTGGNLE